MLHTTTRELVLRALLSSTPTRVDRSWLVTLTGKNKPQIGKEIRALAASGYLNPRSHVLQREHDLLQFYALGWSETGMDSMTFEAIERPTYWIERMRQLSEESGLAYALSGLAACEILSPLIRPKIVEAFVPVEEVGRWREVLEQEGAYRSLSKTGQRIRLISLYRLEIGRFQHRGHSFAPVALIYAQLLSQGGRNQEAAELLLEEWSVRSRRDGKSP